MYSHRQSDIVDLGTAGDVTRGPMPDGPLDTDLVQSRFIGSLCESD